MGNGIYEYIKKYKDGNDKALEEIIKIFNAIINKYSRILEGEDTKQDLSLYLIKIINNITIENKDFYKDKIIFAYIAKSIRNEYIKLSQKYDKRKINETELILDTEIVDDEFGSEIEMLDIFKILTKKEAYIMRLIYVNYLSISEVADFMKVTRQSINQTKNRALKKLRYIYWGSNRKA
ncbi:sigma-70 family RNA polymerase sigma factor [Clostridium gasigenes]|uniref:sigma-70 family RNA polymerase sigma factor n=1 Tax=Clostridium gasigenes TaxID=94869 RepID=UPI001438625C|nr:sigma-70 family RNA polymerase sigma factor [Clostridium gasigenes]NKF05384.1 sigma-70 family RNA polymerase sigma factor [Clostridium gasigenes]QSW18833.1 sigma-70 family RNA polymerase sigma factor [Clostridium gasigenes]